MHPVSGKDFSVAALRLGNFILMMREDQVLSSCMDVDFFTQIFFRHHGALNMPSRTSFSPWRYPVRLSFFFRFPQNKVQGIFFLIFSGNLKRAESRLKVF